MNRSSIHPNRVAAGLSLLALAFILPVIPVRAQAPTVTITIAGDVYGGGKQGAVGTGNLDTGITNATEAENVKFATGKDASAATTVVTLNGGTVRTVFGGGENGRTYGSTNVTVKEVNSTIPTTIGGTVNGKDWTNTIHGGLFGAGDGQSALVFGNSLVTVQGGTVYQNVYGGGNQANLMGMTAVTLQGGNLLKSVFGGARMASIFGYSHVNVDGASAINNLVVNAVYGGNDISGKIQRSTNANWTWVTSLTKPSTLTKATTNGIGNDYNAFVQTTPAGANTNKVYIGQLFGGGNGDYAYTDGGTKLTLNTGLDDDTSTTDVDESKETFSGLELPEVAKAYLELTGGTYGYVYGGGNAATVTDATDICIDNDDDVTLAGMVSGAVVDDTRLHDMGINLTTFTNGYQFIRVFGGNNKATMAIRPTWHLAKGSINDLFSGGNQGDMTYKDGILLKVTGADMTINNIYGGCRMADVDPEGKKGVGLSIAAETVEGQAFQAGYSAKVLVTNGKINNVYGGNDVSGNVYGGTQLEIHHSIIKDVYGGGNGSYAYTDQSALMYDEMYGDFYYTVPAGLTSAQALNKFRPNVEKTWVHVAGESESNPTYIGGALYCGGNSATLRKIGADGLAENDGTEAHLQFGSHVIAKNMFLGSNGENMVRGKVLEFTQNSGGVWESAEKDILAKYADSSFNSMTLTDSPTFEEYMRGVEVAIKPTVSFDDGYTDYSTKVGSLFCGGNVGSMSANGYFDVRFLQKLVIFEKLVGGCNNANVEKSSNNAFHEGGLITQNLPIKVELNVEGLKLEPRKLTYDAGTNTYSFTEWNTDSNGKLLYGNIYGGCYASGYVNGGVRINLKADAISDAVTTAITNGDITPTLDDHRDDVFCTALSVFGAGYGEDAEIWGNTEINISDNANILKVFGGGEMGVVGNLTRDTDGKRTGSIEAPFSTTINLTAGNVGKIYGGGFEGPVTGHTTVNLLGGTAYDVIGGACNADIEDYAETYVGKAGEPTIPTITNNVYGANDFGGTIKGTHAKDFSERVSTTASGMVYNNTLATAEAYVEYVKGSAIYIFGGAKAAYDYKDQTLYSKYANADGTVKGDFVKPAIGNAFVNFRPEYAAANHIARLYGAGQGYYNERDKDLLQNNSYVLIDIPADIEQFASLEVFGAGDYSGVGMNIPAADVRTAEAASTTDVTAAAVIDLVGGNINNVYGGSYKQGFTRRTIVNVPVGSTIDMNYLYGGAYGVASADGHTLGNLYPCDVYESNVNYKSGSARCRTIYGGNNSYRRTLYSHVNIHTPVRYIHPSYGATHANVFGAGYGENTWAQYTEVNLLDSAMVYEPYGGGEAGSVYNKETITSLATSNGWSLAIPGDYDATTDGGLDNALAHTSQLYLDYVSNTAVHEDLATKYNINVAEKYNTNVHIHRGATVVNYAYGAGLGSHIYTYQFDGNQAGNTQPQPSDYTDGATTPEQLDPEARAKYDAAQALYTTYNGYASGATVGAYEYNSFNDTQKSHWKETSHRTTAVVAGTSYIDLLGGTVNKDMYAAGTTGAVQDTLKLGNGTFIASSTAYVKGGMARNVYGGGWEGPVGMHSTVDKNDATNDVLGVANVIVGRPEEEIATEYTAASAADPGIDEDEYFYFNGVPSIRRNVYAGGEGGVVRGTANLNIFNGVVGYQNKHKDDITASENNYYRLAVEDGHVKYIPKKRGDDLSGEDYYFVEEIDQDYVGDNVMFDAGNAFGGGYAANSDVDIANVTLWNGIVRNSMYGGGEIATIGRGTQTKNTSTGEFNVTIYKPGETHVTMMGGHVLRDVFGGGRGFNNWKTEDKTEGNTNGYIFGQTDVNIHFGTIGTLDGLAKGYGNVFGGGNIGFVYSQYGKEADGWYYEDFSTKKLSEDTRVEVKAYARALEPVTIGGTTYAKGAYIPNTALDQLSNSDTDKPTWAKVDQSGITIYNAVFAGGNVSAGSDKIMAFSKTVYGNSTAAVVDIFARDLISVGGKGVGGLYGDGNLTFVDGYRELNITNYGTDWFSLSGGVDSDEEFNKLTTRQQSFYTTQYECITPYGDYDAGDVILNDVYQYVSDADKGKWKRKQSIVNEGRFINTVQRCDFCGIKGSRLVLHGAIDRAQDEAEADYTNYTINRVGELSLNQNRDHGSYFGIYNVVKFLGGVTSDVKFADVRTTGSATTGDYAADGKTYYQWKQAHLDDNMRNDGSAPNKIALSSGVFLEIVKELDANGDKVYGPITGVVELDLLNVSAGEGGGYVYAKNIHGTPTYTAVFADVISDANENLVTNRAFTYATASENDRMQTSGNFIHSLPKHILDDCFPESKSFAGTGAAPAHYWYIRGEYYVYEQLVSAYTGGADAYNKDIRIPLTMSIQGNAKLRLLNVLPGLYADPAKLPNYSYNAENPELSVSDSISIAHGAVIKTYGQGDPISYWDWYNATTSERALFVVDGGVYVCNTEAIIDGKTYYPGQAISVSDYTALAGKTAYDGEGHALVDDNGVAITNAQTLFNIANEVNHDNGYLLTIDFSNPSKWDDYYRHLADQAGDPIKKVAWAGLTDAQKAEYIKSATFTCNASGTYGQYYFNENDVISHSVYAMQSGVTGHVDITTQAQFGEAYIAKDDCEVLVNGVRMSFTKGTSISATEYGTITNASNYFEPAYICVSTVLVGNGDYRVLNQLVGETEYNTWSSEVKEKFQQAYYCTKEGSWGGKYYEIGKNYNGIDYGQLLEAERTHFSYNYDALDALLYNNYVERIENGAYRYDDVEDFKHYITNVGGSNHNTAISVFDKDASTNPLYSASAKIDYTATFNGTSGDEFTYVKDGENIPVTSNVVLSNDQYESLPNDRRYYASFAVSDDHLKDKDDQAWSDGKYHTFIVNHTFDVAGTMYNAGKAISHKDYTNLTSIQQGYVSQVVLDGPGTYYYCIEEYTVGANDANITGGTITPPASVEDVNGTSHAKGTTVSAGTVLNSTTMAQIPNYQLHFEIKGEIPVEETTLYVPVTADINALQRDRYVTAIYEYTYTESDALGLNYETRVEKHILNIRIEFLSGTPVIGPLKTPDLVLPLETVGLDIPSVQEGAFPILGGGWEIYPNEENAKRHRNGREYVNGGEPLYFYQNGYHVAYYALTRMGKTFSDPVPLSVANYQRMADVITDPNHMYINHRENDRDPKIYIDSRSTDTNRNNITFTDSYGVTRTFSNELDAMQGMWDIVNSSYGTEYQEEVNGQSRLITGAQNLDFFLQSEVNSELPSWTSIGGDGTNPCFGGVFHGNGNTVTGLNNSLFGSLCGSVYNLGVMGNFTTGGIANTGEGRIENAWVWTSAASPSGQAVFANPGANAKVINTFYPNANSSFTGSTGNIEITQRTVEEFVNGSVAYDLNRYYLEARYRLFANKNDGSVNDNILYRLPDGTLDKDQTTLIADANGKQPDETGYVTTYANKVYTLNYADDDYARFFKLKDAGQRLGYVEKYVDDGDFRFSDGNKPLKADLRLSSDHGYLPVYPDDYIFFGQKLSYDILNDAGGNTIAHAKHPQAVAKSHTTGSGEDVDNSKHGLLINDLNDRSENRIFRAPAYFGNGTYGSSAIFNARAAFVDSYDFTINGTSYTTTPHHGMTAIDFTGGNGDTKGYQGVVAGLASDFTDRANGYHPLLDYERLDAVQTRGLTQNLLAYTPKADLPGSKNTQTNNVLVGYFRDPAYAETNADYHTVDVQNTTEIRGHVVQQASTTLTGGDYTYNAMVDHLLVDKQDFNAPMAYTFAADKRMWYQRKPAHYAQNLSTATPDNHDAWETVVLPFTAELVTTQTKGEITHFYGDAADAHVGHEYWLREFSGVKEKSGVHEADFERIKNGDNADHTVTNTFLWDYYYSEEIQKDENVDTYQTYYNEPRTYTGYRYLTAGTPYIVAFPGSRYYEFDMSGTFLPQNTYAHTWTTLPAQTVTYASATAAAIPVTDGMSLATTKKESGMDYSFRGTFLNEAGATDYYDVNADGTAFSAVASGAKVPFRAYFDVTTSSTPAPRRIVIGNSDKDGEPEEPMADILTRGLKIYGQKDVIVIESTLDYETTVVVTTVSGKLIGRITVKPEGREVVPVNSRGVYIANRQKVAVL